MTIQKLTNLIHLLDLILLQIIGGNLGSIIFRVDGIFPPTLFCVYKKANIHYIKSAET